MILYRVQVGFQVFNIRVKEGQHSSEDPGSYTFPGSGGRTACEFLNIFKCSYVFF